jgi:hypothetical protein
MTKLPRCCAARCRVAGCWGAGGQLGASWSWRCGGNSPILLSSPRPCPHSPAPTGVSPTLLLCPFPSLPPAHKSRVFPHGRRVLFEGTVPLCASPPPPANLRCLLRCGCAGGHVAVGLLFYTQEVYEGPTDARCVCAVRAAPVRLLGTLPPLRPSHTHTHPRPCKTCGPSPAPRTALAS